MRIVVTGIRLMAAAMVCVFSRIFVRLIGASFFIVSPAAFIWTGFRIGSEINDGNAGKALWFLAGMFLFVWARATIYRFVLRFTRDADRVLMAWERRINAESSSL